MSRYQVSLVCGLAAVIGLAILRVVAIAHGGVLDDATAQAFTGVVAVFLSLLAAGHIGNGKT